MPHWFEGVADTLGAAYLRYSFTKGTVQEVDALVEMLEIGPGHRVLDVGCGPGRHAHELARRGVRVHGIDISKRFIELARADAPEGATFEVADARTWIAGEPFDVAISLCQGAFGLAAGPGSSPGTDPDLDLLRRVVGNIRPGGRLALSAFSAYFQVRNLADSDDFDADAGVNHETTVVRDESGGEHDTELWTTCLTPRELRLIGAAVGLQVDAIHSVRPGRYQVQVPTIDTEEFLLLGTVVGGGWDRGSSD